VASLHRFGRNFIRNTARIQKAAQLSTSELAKATGVSSRTLARMEKARKEGRSYSPMLKTVARLAQAAGVSIDQYLQPARR
jgi:transcriptional regulator with XRE-family HTH domain